MIVHYMQFGYTVCMMLGVPKDWLEGHWWVGEWSEVTCAACLAGKAIAMTFELLDGGTAFKCLRCHSVSRNPNDVENHYCGHCHVFHDNIWPPARKWWVEHPDPPRHDLRDGQPCSPGCLSHVSHPCECCGRIAGRGDYHAPKKPTLCPLE